MPEPPVPAARYESYSHEAMAAEVERGNDPAAAGEAGARWEGLAKRLQESTAGVAALVASSEESWRGDAGDAARAALDRAARWLGHSAAVSASVGRAVGAQAEAAARARADMPPPVAYDPAAMIRDAASSGNLLVLAGLADEMAARRAEAEAARQKAIDVMRTRDAALRGHVPAEAFPAPPALGRA
ncbi:PPE domain-containing protein [Amycolatopsis balhimycina DSM 5908]|uniref:PPE domain-containing protein n=1 Tax=Amycolatopsis balhimycina DSM 5908 TaxID=1081091 RepID=A0A428VUH4_AMYBA|nr:PPE domain-containing protein [Amycolatopsis balhimycina]RSM34476.1 PPE domain-containing protein [Amycolatopsis balhimycina DSM 5908]